MRDVNVGDEADSSAVEALIFLSNHTTLGLITKMKKLSAVIAVLFASASLSVLAQGTAAPAKSADDTAKTTTTAPAKADSAKMEAPKTDATKTDDTKGKKKPKHKKAPKKPKTEGKPAPAPAPAPAAGDTKNDTKTK